MLSFQCFDYSEIERTRQCENLSCFIVQLSVLLTLVIYFLTCKVLKMTTQYLGGVNLENAVWIQMSHFSGNILTDLGKVLCPFSYYLKFLYYSLLYMKPYTFWHRWAGWRSLKWCIASVLMLTERSMFLEIH